MPQPALGLEQDHASHDGSSRDGCRPISGKELRLGTPRLGSHRTQMPWSCVTLCMQVFERLMLT